MNRQTILLGIVVLLVVVRFVIVPLGDYRETLVNDLANKQQKLNKWQKSEAAITEFLESEAAIDQALSELKGRFIVTFDDNFAMLDFQKQLDNLAREHSVTLKNLQWKTPVSGFPSHVDVEIRFEGQLKNLMQFHSRVGELKYSPVTLDFFVNVIRQNIGWKQLGNSNGNITLRIHYLKETQ